MDNAQCIFITIQRVRDEKLDQQLNDNNELLILSRYIFCIGLFVLIL